MATELPGLGYQSVASRNSAEDLTARRSGGTSRSNEMNLSVSLCARSRIIYVLFGDKNGVILPNTVEQDPGKETYFLTSREASKRQLRSYVLLTLARKLTTAHQCFERHFSNTACNSLCYLLEIKKKEVWREIHTSSNII